MSTLDTVFLIITACGITLFFLTGTVLLLVALKRVKSVKRVVAKAENVIDSVEEATDIIRDASGPLAVFKVIKNITQLVHNKRK